MTERSLVVVGSVALDDIETAEEARTGLLGGSASYFSVGASLLCPVSLVAVVGEDFPEEYLEILRGRQVDLKGLDRAQGRTFHWAGRYSEDFSSRESLATDLNVFADFEPELPPEYRRASHVFLANIHPTLQAQVLDQLERPAFVAADTMNFWIQGTPQELAALLPRLDLLFLNDAEVRLLGHNASIPKAAAKVLAMGPKALVVKRGEHGASLYGADGAFHLPAYPIAEVRDPTGAGDTFAAGFMGYLAARGAMPPSFEDLKQALAVGTALASFTVEDFSLAGLLRATRAELYERYRTVGNLVRFQLLPEL